MERKLKLVLALGIAPSELAIVLPQKILCRKAVNCDTTKITSVKENLNNLDYFLFLYYRFLKFIFREGKGGEKRGRETSMCGCLSHATY